jgi:FADH2-dependent halogenase
MVKFRHGEDEHAVTGKFLIDATGQANFTGNRDGLKQNFEGHRKVALFGHFSGIPLPEGERQGDIIIVRLEDGWFWIIPLSPEKVSVGLVCDVKRFKDSGLKPKEMFDSVVAGSVALSAQLAHAELLGKLHVVSDFSYQNKCFASPRLVRAGDAAGFLDPIFSSGVYLAMTSARDAAKAVSKAVDQNVAMNSDIKRYEKGLRREMAQYWKLIKNYYTTPFIDLFMTPDPPLNLRSAVNSVLAGRLHQSWAVRWRLWAFYWCVRIQKKFPLAPRTDFA